MSFEMLKNRFGERVFANKERTVRAALDNAYADMSRRQNGHTPEIKNACIDYLVEVFSNTFQIEDFDAWHQALCMELINRWNSVSEDFGTVGKAQKVLNMTFKYLACISNAYDGIFPSCHMTLDSYTLDWYEAAVKPWAKAQHRRVGRKVAAWSKIRSYEEYLLIQQNIRLYLASGAHYSISIGSAQTPAMPLPTAPIDAEFIVWEGQIIARKYNGLMKLLEDYAEENSESYPERGYDTWLVGTLFQDYLREYLSKF